MDDATFEAQKARVSKLLERWLPVFGLDRWQVRLTWEREHDADNRALLGTSDPLWQYFEVGLTFFLPVVLERVDTALEEDVCHELAHALTEPLNRAWDSHDDRQLIVEMVTSHLARAVIAARLAGANDLPNGVEILSNEELLRAVNHGH